MITDKQLREMAQSALDNWDFDEETDPNGTINDGLRYILSQSEWDEDVIDAQLKSLNDWDGLEEWAIALGHELKLG